jgi:hypothetical protein
MSWAWHSFSGPVDLKFVSCNKNKDEWDGGGGKVYVRCDEGGGLVRISQPPTKKV